MYGITKFASNAHESLGEKLLMLRYFTVEGLASISVFEIKALVLAIFSFNLATSWASPSEGEVLKLWKLTYMYSKNWGELMNSFIVLAVTSFSAMVCLASDLDDSFGGGIHLKHSLLHFQLRIKHENAFL